MFFKHFFQSIFFFEGRYTLAKSSFCYWHNNAVCSLVLTLVPLTAELAILLTRILNPLKVWHYIHLAASP